MVARMAAGSDPLLSTTSCWFLMSTEHGVESFGLVACGIKPTDDATDACSGYHVDGHANFFHYLQSAHFSCSPCTAATQDQSNAWPLACLFVLCP